MRRGRTEAADWVPDDPGVIPLFAFYIEQLDARPSLVPTGMPLPSHAAASSRDIAANMATEIDAAVRRFAALWNEPGLPVAVTVRLSTRMRRSVGLCRPASGRIALNRQLLAGDTALLHEVLCHELAHVVVYRRHQRVPVPHGPEWQALVRAAGYVPSTTLRMAMGERPAPSTRRGYTVVHRCPVCHTQRVARRPVTRWRCAECHAAGLDGVMEVTPLEPGQ
jgi:predicted SprT family Zn-dependent metalloprotease